MPADNWPNINIMTISVQIFLTQPPFSVKGRNVQRMKFIVKHQVLFRFQPLRAKEQGQNFIPMFNNQTGRRGYQHCHRKYSIVQSKECNFYFFLNWILFLSLFWSVHSLSEIQVQAGSQAVKCRKSLSRSTQVDGKQTPQNKKISALLHFISPERTENPVCG